MAKAARTKDTKAKRAKAKVARSGTRTRAEPKPRVQPPGHGLREIDGFLFIGDPHVSSVRPGRRKDKDYPGTILGKLAHAIGIANERRLLPVVLGDLFDRPKEDDENVKTKLIRILRKAWTQPIVLVGNHDRRHAVLTDGDSLAFFAESGVVHAVAKSGPIEEFAVGPEGVRIALGGTPHGQDIPNDVRPLFPEARTVVWITHHDIAFDGAYPGAIEPFDILGCPLVINGHMHLTKPTRTPVRTTWFNPGNITRQAIDAIDHVPRVWELQPDGNLLPHELPHERDVFDLTGKLVDAVSPGEIPPEDSEEGDNQFIELLQAEASTEMARTDDGSVLREEIEAKAAREGTPPEVLAAVLSLLNAVTSKSSAADEEESDAS